MSRRFLFIPVLVIGAAVCAFAQAPVVAQGGVVNAASFRPVGAPNSAVAAGAIVSIFGSNLATAVRAATTIPLPFELDGTRVTFAGRAAALFFVSPGQINAQIPWGVAVGTAQIVVTTARGSSVAVSVTIVASAPGLFSQTASGSGAGAIQNALADGSVPLNTSTVGVPADGVVVIYGAGFGAVSPTPADGAAATGLSPTTATAAVLIGGRNAEVLYVGLTPGLVGLYQINARVPAGTPEGCFLPVTVAFGAAVSNAVTLSVKNNRGNCNDAPSGTPAGFLNGSIGTLGLSKTTFQAATPLPIPIPPIPDTFSGSFFRFEKALPVFPGTVFPPIGGGCIATVLSLGADGTIPGFDFTGFQIRVLNAGTLTLTGPFSGSPRTLPYSAANMGYQTELGQNALQPGAWSVSASGGADIGPFSSTLNIPGLFTVTNFGMTGASVSQSQPLRVTWNCPDTSATSAVGITLVSMDFERRLFGLIVCCPACRDGQVTLPPELLRQIPPSMVAGATITAGFTSFSEANRIRATGLDFGFFSYAISSTLAQWTLTQ